MALTDMQVRDSSKRKRAFTNFCVGYKQLSPFMCVSRTFRFICTLKDDAGAYGYAYVVPGAIVMFLAEGRYHSKVLLRLLLLLTQAIQ